MLKVFKITFETKGQNFDDIRVLSDRLENAVKVAAEAYPNKVIRWSSMEGDCLLDRQLVTEKENEPEFAGQD